MRLLVTRPEPDAGRFAAALGEAGVAALVAPLMTITRRPGVTPDLDGMDAIAVTSANGVRALAAMSASRSLPVYAVGPGSAAAAGEAGFGVAATAGGDVTSLADTILAALPAGAAVYHAAGRDRAGDLAALLEAGGLRCRREVLYAAEAAAALPAAAAAALREGALDGAVFFSPRSARVFVSLARDAELSDACAGLDLFALSPAVAAAAGEGAAWRRVAVAESPTQAALLGIIRAHAGGDALP